MDVQFLKELLPILRDCRVESLKLEGIEIRFKADPTKFVQANVAPAGNSRNGPTSELPGGVLSSSLESHACPKPVSTEKVADAVVPQGLEEEEKMDFDKILHWSSPDNNEGDVPLTGEAPPSSPEVTGE